MYLFNLSSAFISISWKIYLLYNGHLLSNLRIEFYLAKLLIRSRNCGVECGSNPSSDSRWPTFIKIISFYCKQFRVIRSLWIVKGINNLFCVTIVNIYKIHVFLSRFLNVLVGRYLVGTPRHKEILNVKLLRGHSIFVPTNFLVNAISKNSQRTKPVTPASFVY